MRIRLRKLEIIAWSKRKSYKRKSYYKLEKVLQDKRNKKSCISERSFNKAAGSAVGSVAGSA